VWKARFRHGQFERPKIANHNAEIGMCVGVQHNVTDLVRYHTPSKTGRTMLKSFTISEDRTSQVAHYTLRTASNAKMLNEHASSSHHNAPYE
jgi:hypothetical protein